MPGDRPDRNQPRSTDVVVRVSVLEPRLEDDPPARTGVCRLVVESTRPLPSAPYAGTTRVTAVYEAANGQYPVRLLKHFEIDPIEIAPGTGVYRLAIDLSDEWPGPPPGAYVPPSYRPRRVSEPVETVCKRVAGLFARHCEQFRPPTVSVRLEP